MCKNPFDYKEEYKQMEAEAYAAMEAEAYSHQKDMERNLYLEEIEAEYHREMMEDAFGPLYERF